MNIETCVSWKYIGEYDLEGKTLLVIDTLRATSVMVTAMENGARSLTAVETTEEALSLKAKNPSLILGGEREGLKLKGFDLSNSPLEYTGERVKGKDIVMTTSNGTRTIAAAGTGRDILIASLLNARAVSEKIREEGRDTVIINAGTMGRLSLDDFITGGLISSYLKDASYCDTTMASVLSAENPSWKEMIRNALHYKRMLFLKYNEDLNYCFRINSVNTVPVMKNFRINS